MKVRFLSAALAALALCAPPAVAQPDPPPLVAADPPPVLKRVSDLERENVLLKARVAALEGKRDTPAGETADRWTVPQFPGTVFTKAQLAAMYPGITFNAAAPGVASTSAPFPCSEAGCGLLGCNSTLTTPATAAGTPATPRTYGPEPEAAADTSTSARGVVRAGGTSGCSAAGCSAPAARGRWYLGKNLGR